MADAKEAPRSSHQDDSGSPKGRLAKLSLAALGVVYGDIGTSPLYAIRECFFGSSHIPVTHAHMLGVLSLVFWALILVISIKYMLVVMRADNHGEGGILALLALVDPWRRKRGKRFSALLVLLGVFGAALLFGDGMITPAISVLSAVEGLRVAEPATQAWILPLTIGILITLFWFQRRGSERIGILFGPIMVVWFITLGTLGLYGISQYPAVLYGLNPAEAAHFVWFSPGMAFIVLSGVFLVVTGGEALYADLGHFGGTPIRLAWFTLVLPALILNYFGQGAYIMSHPGQTTHPFYNLVPGWLQYPMVGLATVVTVIASQAVISGVFSLVGQAVALNQSPPMLILQTSSRERGQVYVPLMNVTLLAGTIGLVLGFRTSSNLAAAYGVAVSTTMVITTWLIFVVMRERWRLRRAWVVPLCGLFLAVDLAFFTGNLNKVAEGGWFPLLVAILTLVMMDTWYRGRRLFMRRLSSRSVDVQMFLDSIRREPPPRIEGAAVFITPPGNEVPGGLLHHLKLNRMLHETVLLVTSTTEDVPRVPASERCEVQELEQGFYRIFLHYGFMQSPNVPVGIKFCLDQKLLPDLDIDQMAFYVDRAILHLDDAKQDMPRWRRRLYAFMVRNSQRPVEYYKLPPGRSIELGVQVAL